MYNEAHTLTRTKSAYATQNLIPKTLQTVAQIWPSHADVGLIEGRALVQGRNQTAIYEHTLRASKSV